MTLRGLSLLALIPCLLWCGGCGSSSSGGATPGNGGNGQPLGPTTSSGCGAAATPSGKSGDTRSLQVDGTTRSYLRFIPSGYDSSRTYPVVIVFHGMGSSGQQMANYISMQTYSAGNAIVVFPNGLGGNWDMTGDTDLLFVDAMLADLQGSLCTNPSRTFALGFSMGAYMANHLGCQRSATIRAIAAADGGFLDHPSACGKTAALIYHRTNDDNEVIANGQNARDNWLSINGCASTSTPFLADGFASLGCVQYDGCPSATPVLWCEDTFTNGNDHDLRDIYRVPIWNWFDAF
ncbi:MAG: hypothetical protein FWD73_17160 [Polyangiaceae bacterium]|nr:hypothetical protein [Polyangiaceae bacterium]